MEAAGEPSTQPNEPVTDQAAGSNNLKQKASRQQSPNPATSYPTDTIEEVVQAADEPAGKSQKGFLRSVKQKLSRKKKKNHSKSEVPPNEEPPNRRITSFTDGFLEYKFKDKERPYGRGMCVIFAFFTSDLPGYVHDVTNLETHFKDLQYEVRSGPGYTNIKRAELFERIAEVNTYMDEDKAFDRLVVVILTHGKTDGLLTCEARDGLIEEQKRVDKNGPFLPVKTTVAEIVDDFKHDRLKSMKDMPKLFLVQACRGQSVVKAANVPNQPGLEDVDASGLDTSGLRFNIQSPIDGDILVCNSTTEHHTALTNEHTGSWFIQKTLEVFRKYQTSQHVVDMMTVVTLAVSECRGVVKKEDGKSSEAIQIPCILSTLRKKCYLYNAQTTNPPTKGNQYSSPPK